MHLRNGDHGYGAVTKTLHWLTVGLVTLQFLVGYAMDDGGGGRGRGRGGEPGRGRGRGGAEEALDLLPVHVTLGLLILAVAVLRVLWRRRAQLPPWAEQLSENERSFLHATEVALLTLLFVVPLTGLALVLGDDDLLALHVIAHIAFFVAVAAHVGFVVGRRLVGRMLPAAPRSR